MKQLTHGSLFAGIGGFDLGFERAGIKTVWQVEIDPFCRKVLERHFPDARRYQNIKRVKRLAPVDIIGGGFPCQDISHAGKRAGIEGKRSGLWGEMWRIIRIVRPRFVVVENVAALLGRGMGRVLGDLAAIGYDAEWDCLPACAFGAHHIRDRVWIIAYPKGDLRRAPWNERPAPFNGSYPLLANSADNWTGRRKQLAEGSEGSRNVADSNVSGLEGRAETLRPQGQRGSDSGHDRTQIGGIWRNGQWDIEPNVGRVANGVPARMDRLRSLGNSIVPQIAEWIGRRIIEAESVS